MSLLLNMLSRLIITFLPRSRRLLISWLQSPSAVILEPKNHLSCSKALLNASSSRQSQEWANLWFQYTETPFLVWPKHSRFGACLRSGLNFHCFICLGNWGYLTSETTTSIMWRKKKRIPTSHHITKQIPAVPYIRSYIEIIKIRLRKHKAIL